MLLPASNVEHLMLKAEVREAMEAGTFRVFAIHHVDEALALLTGLEHGEADEHGAFPDASLNGRVRSRLTSFRKTIKAARGKGEIEKNEGVKEEGAAEDIALHLW